MPRKTKLEKQAEVAEYNRQLEAKQAALYPQELMDTLERATKTNFQIEVKDGNFVVTDRDDRWFAPRVIALNYGSRTHWELSSLMADVSIKEDKQREQERKLQVRQTALAKLTQEERRELGL
jgi:hypothetical protein